MAFFKLNIHEINGNVERHVGYLNSLKEQVDLVYNSLIGADAYWNDMNTISFISRVKSDGYKLNDYIIYLNNIYKELLYFSDDVKNTCSKYGYKNTRTIKFNDTRLSECLRYLNQAIEILNINLKRLNSLTQDVQYVSLSSVYEKISQINKLIGLIDVLKNDLSDFCNSINVCVSDSKIRKSKIEKNQLGISLVKYAWNLTERDVSVTKATVVTNAVANKSTMSFAQNNSNLNVGVVNPTVVSNQQIGVKNSNDFSLGYNTASYSGVAKANIDYEYNNAGLQVNSSHYSMPNNMNAVNTSYNNDVNMNIPNSYVVSGVTNNINSNMSQDVNLEQINSVQATSNRINLNNFNNNSNNVSVNSISSDSVQTNRMNFSNNMGSVNLNSEAISAYAKPNSNTIGNIGNK